VKQLVNSRKRRFVTQGEGSNDSAAARRFREPKHDTWICDNPSTGHTSNVAGPPLWIGDLGDVQARNAAFSSTLRESIPELAGATLIAEFLPESLDDFVKHPSQGVTLPDATRRPRMQRLELSVICTCYGHFPGDGLQKDSRHNSIDSSARSKLALKWWQAGCTGGLGPGDNAGLRIPSRGPRQHCRRDRGLEFPESGR